MVEKYFCYNYVLAKVWGEGKLFVQVIKRIEKIRVLEIKIQL